jgi:DNA-binding MarR family transcriptional regulator
LARRFQKEKLPFFVASEDMTSSENSVITAIYMARLHGIDPVYPRAVAAWLHLTPSALSQLLRSLEEKGYLERHRTAEDSRAVALSLTTKGNEAGEEAVRNHDRFVEELFAYVGEEDIQRLIGILNKVLDFLSQKGKDEGKEPRGAPGAAFVEADAPPCGLDKDGAPACGLEGFLPCSPAGESPRAEGFLGPPCAAPRLHPPVFPYSPFDRKEPPCA